VANVVVGITGGIAAYKSASLIRLISEASKSVQVVATANAHRFIGQITLEALSKNPVEVVDPDLYTDVDQVKHITIAKNAYCIVVAPATASFIAKIAAGIADDLLTSTVLAATCPVLIAPAMHTEMWLNAATVSNIATLKQRGIEIIEPAVGRLTGADTGVGRLAEPEEILARVERTLAGGLLKGFRVLVTTGGTRERIDAARYVGNYSSGKQGFAFARAAFELGADVKVIAANAKSSDSNTYSVEEVSTAAELETKIMSHINDFDILIMAAAVADYRPKTAFPGKLKRSELGSEISIELVANEDVLAAVTTRLRADGSNATVIGFAAEASADLVNLGLVKMKAKGCAFMFVNDIASGEVFGSDDNSGVLVYPAGSQPVAGSKIEVARTVLRLVATKVIKAKGK
jgi:phosphopantothenoylcysteine decarboxylase/phosphopantothenate--cysteine ligase